MVYDVMDLSTYRLGLCIVIDDLSRVGLRSLGHPVYGCTTLGVIYAFPWVDVKDILDQGDEADKVCNRCGELPNGALNQ